MSIDEGSISYHVHNGIVDPNSDVRWSAATYSPSAGCYRALLVAFLLLPVPPAAVTDRQ